MSEWAKRTEEQLPQYLNNLSNDIKTAHKNKEDPGFLSGIIGGGAGVIGGIADFSDALTGYGRDVGDYFNDVAQRNARTKEYEWTDMIPFVSDYYTNPQGFRYGLGQQIGSSLPLMLGGGGVGRVGGSVIGALGGRGLINNLTANWARKGIAVGALSAPFEAASEGGNLYRDMTTSDENGKFAFTDQLASNAAVTDFWRNLPLLTAGNALEGGLLGGMKVPGTRIGYGDGLLKRSVKGALPPAIVNAAQEGTTEALQEGISGNLKGDQVFDIWDTSTWDNPFSSGQKMAAAEAALGSALMGGAPGAYRGAKSSPQLRVGNDVEDYNGVDSDVKNAANTFGKYLYDNFQIDPTVTSGRRSEKNNAVVNGAKNSWHLKGRAVDLDVGDISDEQAEQIRQAAEDEGWGEVLYHDAGSGKHLHLANYQKKGDTESNNSNDQFESFLSAISGQESGGNYSAKNERTGATGKYQIMPENWPSWSQEAGLSQDAEMTPENQEIVARFKLKQYYEKYGARGAAIAWYAGEGANSYSDEALNRKQGKGNEPSINEYADSVLSRMSGANGKAVSQITVADLNEAQQQGIIDWAQDYRDALDESGIDDINFIDDNINDPVALFERYKNNEFEKMAAYIGIKDHAQGGDAVIPQQNSSLDNIPEVIHQPNLSKADHFDLPEYESVEFQNNPILKGNSTNIIRDDKRFTSVPDHFDNTEVRELSKRNNESQLMDGLNITQAMPQRQNTQEQSESSINRLKQEFREYVLKGQNEQAVQVGSKLLSLIGDKDTMQFVSAVRAELDRQSAAKSKDDTAKGTTLLRTLKENRVRVNSDLVEGLKNNRPLAIKAAEERLASVAVSDSSAALPASKNSSMGYGKRLLEAAKANGVPTNDYFRSQLQANHPQAVKRMEEKLSSAGTNIGKNNQRKTKAKVKPREKISAKHIDKSVYGDNQKATLRGNVISVEGTTKVFKGDNKASYDVTIEEVEKAKKKYGNPQYGIRELIQLKHDESIEDWINQSSTEELKSERRETWENDLISGKLGALNERVIDSQVRAIENVYDQYQAHKGLSKENKENPDNIFGDTSVAEDELLSALGLERKKSNEKKLFNIVDDSDEAIQEYIQQFKKAQNGKLSANVFLDPSLMIPAFKIGTAYMQRGINQFARWSKQMTNVLGVAIDPWLQSIWKSIESYPKNLPFDEKQMSAAFKYVGAKYESGIHDTDKIFYEFESLVGKEKAAAFKPLLKSAFAGVDEYFNPTADMVKLKETGDVKNVNNDSTSLVASRTGEGADKNQVGANDGGGESSRRGQRAVQSPQIGGEKPRGSVLVHGDSALGSGKVGDSGVQAAESEDRSSSTGGEHLSGGVRDNFDGTSKLDSGESGRDIVSSQDRRNNAADQVKKSKSIYKAGDLDSVKSDLPMLLPEQQEDVVFAERRLLENQGAGVMFTNGTGTGKTYTGLGIVKRFLSQGKEDILIVTPSDKINDDWKKAAKDSFEMQISKLKDTRDAGRGISITTFANMGDNNQLVNRHWDLVLVDESQNLMSSEKGTPTNALENLRALTFHERGLYDRFRRLHADEYEEIERMNDESQKVKLVEDLNQKQKKAIEGWRIIPEKEKTKVVLLSATPFAYVNNIDYAEGYLFDYSKQKSTGYNRPDGKARFMIENFGYRMRFNKLTRPEGSVDSSVFEVQFHEKLRKDGVLSGRMLTLDKDYDRGFILIDGGIGYKIDEGFKWLRECENGNFSDLHEYLQNKFKHQQRMYLLEAIKARESIDLIKQYRENGKKVVVFHDYKKGGATHPFNLQVPPELQEKYADFAARRPDLIGMDLRGLKSPIQTLSDAFGDELLLFNGDVNKAQREENVKLFNDDDSGKNIILVQSDAGQAGINLHDKTGKHHRVLINLGMPTKPVAAIQIEGRIYRTGQQSNAVFRYLNTGTMMERVAFANKIAERASTAENLAMGKDARALREAFVEAFEETLSDAWQQKLPGGDGEGIGGKEKDKAIRGAASEFDRAKIFYYGRSKKNSKNKSAEGTDYFATPEPLGLKMVEWAGIKAGEKVLEPSAGHGAISRWFSPNTENVMIEPSYELATSAQMKSNASLINSNFEDYYVGNKFDAVVMNPPFGSGGKTAVEHLMKAFRHLRDGGRVVAIIPDGLSCQKYFDKWYYGNESGKTKAEREGEKSAVLVKEIQLPGVVFKNAGTQVACKVLVIDKQETQEGRDNTETQSPVALRDIKTIEEFFERIENLNIPPRYSNEEAIKDVTIGDNTRSNEMSANFNLDNHRNTKTGEIKSRAAFKKHVEDFKSINSLAKRHGGYYSRFAKGFLFDDETARGHFLSEAEAILTNCRFSKRGAFDNIDFLRDDELTMREKRLQKAGKAFGVPIVFFKSEKTLDGFHGGNTTFINRDSERPANWTFWHETFHWLRNNNDGLYRDMLYYIKEHDTFTQKQIDEYRSNNDRMDLTNDQAIEEMLADHMPDVARRIGLMKQLAKDNPSLAERFVAWIRDIMDRFHEFFINKIGVADGMTGSQKKAMIEAFTNLAADMVDSEGHRLFKVKYGGKIYLRRNGQPVSVALHVSPIAMSGKGENPLSSAIERRALDLKHLGYTRGETMDILVDEYMPENYDPSVSAFGYPQHEKLKENFLAFWKGVERAISTGESYKSIENKLLTTYNMRKGISDRRMSLDESVNNLAIYKGAIWNVREKFREELGRTGINPDGEKGRSILHGSVTSFLGGSAAWRREQRRQGRSLNPSNSTGFSMPENKYSKRGSTLFELAADKLAKKIGLKTTPRGNVKIQTTSRKDQLGILDAWVRSPSEIAKKHPIFAPFFRYAASSVERQEKLRNQYAQKMKKVRELLKSNKDLESCTQILLSGDHEQKEYNLQELRQAGMSDKSIRAYLMIRGAMKDTYNLINDARQQVKNHSKRIGGAELAELKKNKFIKILKEQQTGNDEYLVTYKSPKLYRKKDEIINETALKELREDDNVQILHGVDVGEGLYRVTYEHQAPPLTNRNGYIPHFFHEYMIMKKAGEKYESVGSGKTLSDAVEIANTFAEKNPNEEYMIRQKGFRYDGKEREIAAIVGDHEFDRMSKQIERHTDMSIKDAKEFLRESAGVSLKNRHRFYGNALHRTGAEGFETDLMWILNHHFNAASRYVALEENFKPQAISLFERVFGRFDSDYTGNTNAQYAKDYINDVNGNPTAIETKLNETLKNNPYFQSVLGDTFGDRPALQISSGISGTMAKAKLGFLNTSSALLNLTQFLNIVGRLNSYSYAVEGIGRAFNPTALDELIIEESGALNDINIAADAGGYTQSRGGQFGGPKGKLRFAFKNLNALMDKGMFFFTKIDALMRKAAVLGAYHQAMKEKGYAPDLGSKLSSKALKYAKEVNRESNFDYGAHDTPNIIRRGSVLTQNALQFQKFPIKQLEFMWNTLNNGSKKQLYTFWLPYILVAGIGQFPFADWADELIEMLTSGRFKPKVDGKKALMDWAGKDKNKQVIVNAMMYGGMSVVGIDISQRAGMGDIFNGLNLAGPAGSTITGMLRQAGNGNPIETIKAFSPGVGNMLQAIAGETRTTRHRVGSTYEGWDRVLKAAGFRTIDEAVASDIKTISLTEAERKKNREASAIDAYIEKPTAENLKKLKALKIKPERVQEERRKKRMNNRERTIDGMGKDQQKNLKGLVEYTK